jgi:beta-mannosidase
MTPETGPELRTRTLHEGWHLIPLVGIGVPEIVRGAGPIPARVPGVVHLDLMAAGLLADPYLGTNERLQEWIGSTSWRYTTEFEWQGSGAERVDLAALGLDTLATVRLNGRVVLQSQNQHRSYRVPVEQLLQDGRNRLEVDFAAPVPEADRVGLELGYRPHVNHHPFNAIRKMACSFGWDWGPDTATSGIWRPLLLESWSVARIADLVVSPTVSGGEGLVDVRVTATTTGSTPVAVRASVGGDESTVLLEGGAARLSLRVPDVRRWWPRGRGDQVRYELRVDLCAGTEVLDSRVRRIGFRTVEVDTRPDGAGAPFAIMVNGEPVWVKGVNWIPDDAFPGRVDRARYAERLTQAADANINLVRVWGGGIFESEDFYDLADEQGLLVWQDFLMACAAYSEEEPLASEIAAESREAVIRLGSHPSLVLLNGNNENLWGHGEWNWAPRLEGRTWGTRYYYELLPELVADLAPHVAYTPGSPFSPDRSTEPNDPDHGTMHIWDVWNSQDYPHYRDHRPRFVSEFGWQGPPTWSTLRRALPDSPLTPESPGMLVHQKAADGNVKLVDGLVAHLPLPTTMPEWHWATSLNQAMAIRTAIEYFRSLQPHCSGAIVWQLNDCWPAVSWAAVDGYGRKKPLWYALRAAFADRLVALQPHDDGLALTVVNDGRRAWTTPVALERRDFDGRVLASATATVSVAAGSSARVVVDAAVATPQRREAELVRVVAGEEVAYWFFCEARDSLLPPEELSTAVRAVDCGVEVTVTAAALVRELSLLPDVVDPAAEVDRMLVTLLPGEQTIFTITTDADLDPQRFVAPDVLRTMNALVNQRGAIERTASGRRAIDTRTDVGRTIV